MRPTAVVLGWALFNAVLVLVLGVVFGGDAVEVGLYVAAVALITGFGAAVLLAARTQRQPQQLRQPARSTSVALLAAGCLLVGLGAVYHWWIALTAVYPVLAALVLRRGERLPAGARPAPVSTADAASPYPALVGPLPYTGPPGATEDLPDEHPARGAPRPVAPHQRGRGPRGALPLVVLARAVLRAVSRRGRP